jgi:hypothetical protein
VYHRSANTRLWESISTAFVEIGKGYYGFEFAHSVRVDAQDNIWTVDEGTNTVTKFSPEGKFLMVLGRRPRRSTASSPRPLTEPAARVQILVPRTWAGTRKATFRLRRYCNNRVVKFTRTQVPRAGGQREAG